MIFVYISNMFCSLLLGLLAWAFLGSNIRRLQACFPESSRIIIIRQRSAVRLAFKRLLSRSRPFRRFSVIEIISFSAMTTQKREQRRCFCILHDSQSGQRRIVAVQRLKTQSFMRWIMINYSLCPPFRHVYRLCTRLNLNIFCDRTFTSKHRRLLRD